MTSRANNEDLDALARAWREFQTRIPVKLRTVRNESHYRAMINLLNKLVDEIGGRETHPLMSLLDIVTFFVRDYEERNIEIPGAEPPAILRLLMKQHNLRQTDLAEVFGSRSNVSKFLHGKREISIRQARALGRRFGISRDVFIP